MTKYYAVDSENDDWEEYNSETDAVHSAEELLKYYRDDCDPEWPMGVDGVVVVFGVRNPDSGENYEGCKLLYRATETDRQELEPEDAEACGYNYSCDYEMQPYR